MSSIVEGRPVAVGIGGGKVELMSLEYDSSGVDSGGGSSKRDVPAWLRLVMTPEVESPCLACLVVSCEKEYIPSEGGGKAASRLLVLRIVPPSLLFVISNGGMLLLGSESTDLGTDFITLVA